ncbi:MAG: SMC-Scp complex subunit ScpB [Phyllobacteriaceae bacterium]|nr:SMC-Scp complex subunit ScpB [Phyllobacteriaceae bacterium]
MNEDAEEDRGEAPWSEREAARVIEAALFASAEPVEAAALAELVGGRVDVDAVLAGLVEDYRGRGVELVEVAGKWLFRTAADLAPRLSRHVEEPRRLGRAALEVLAIVAYHQPVTRAEIEQIRGVSMSKGTLDQLLEAGWVRMRGRRRTPGRPITWGITDAFLVHFGLESVRDLPGLDELKAAGLLEGQIPAGFRVPLPIDGDALTADEDPLEPGDLVDLALAAAEDEGD